MLNQPAEGFTPMAVEPIPSYSLTGKDKKTFTSELTAIEKGRLIDILNQPAEGFKPTAGEPIPSYSLVGKDKKLLSLPN